MNWSVSGVGQVLGVCESDSGTPGSIKFRGISWIVEALTFIGPCIVIYFYSKTNEIHHFLKFILFCRCTLHVSDGLSIHHQESKTVHTASGVRQTDFADCLLGGTRCSISFPLASSQQNLFDIYLMPYVQS